MLQDLTGGEPVPAAQDQDVARLRDPAERRMNQRLVVTIFVAGGELKIAVEEEPEIVAAAGEDDTLERRRFGVDDRLLVTRRFRPALHSVQIGRASCRESGCLSVVISVVAVSFKKRK